MRHLSSRQASRCFAFLDGPQLLTCRSELERVQVSVPSPKLAKLTIHSMDQVITRSDQEVTIGI